MVRCPTAAGRFYPSDGDLLTQEVKLHVKQSLERKPTKKIRAIGVVSPHAGLMYSGDVAGAVYSKIKIPDTIILLGPNHTGLGKKVSVMTEGTWNMPQGMVQIDTHLANEICKNSLLCKKDAQAHRKEHSLETQLPFLQFYNHAFKIVPICMMQLTFDECEELGHILAKAIKQSKRQVLIVASSDMTHYETHKNALKNDKSVINQVLKLDAKELYKTVKENNISMCGVSPTTVMLIGAKEIGAKKALLAKYMTSGEVNGNMDKVVGYAGLIIK